MMGRLWEGCGYEALPSLQILPVVGRTATSQTRRCDITAKEADWTSCIMHHDSGAPKRRLYSWQRMRLNAGLKSKKNSHDSRRARGV